MCPQNAPKPKEEKKVGTPLKKLNSVSKPSPKASNGTPVKTMQVPKDEPALREPLEDLSDDPIGASLRDRGGNDKSCTTAEATKKKISYPRALNLKTKGGNLLLSFVIDEPK